MKLSEYAKKNSMTYQSAWNHFNKGLIPNARQLPSGTVVIDEIVENDKPEYVIVYARVSSSENKDNLNSQAERLTQFCTAKGWVVNEVIKECGSGLNDNRPKLIKIFKERKATKLVIEHKDRLTRFGFNYIKTLFNDCEIIVVNECETDQDLFEDFISLVTSFCARIYGKRRSKRKTEQIIQSLENEHNEGDDNDDIS
jgi:predicted site-specific integrase-resolvase